MYGYVDIGAHINTHTHTHTYTHTHTPPLLTKQKRHQCARIQLEKKERTSHICRRINGRERSELNKGPDGSEKT